MTRYIVGVDIGGTNLVVGCVAEDGSALHGLVSEPTMPESGADDVMTRLLALARRSMAEARAAVPGIRIAGVGVGAPGPLDRKRGVVLLTPNLGWTNMPLRDRVSQGLELPAALDNDANCAVLGEWWIGAAEGARHAVGITIGTGIGGGLIVNGEMVSRRIGLRRRNRPRDDRDRRPALQVRQLRLSRGLCLGAGHRPPRRRRGESGRQQPPGRVRRRRSHQGHGPDRLRGGARRTTCSPCEVVSDTARFLGTGIANLLNVFNPEVVVVCGGVTLAGDHLFVPSRREVARRAFKPAVEACRIVPGAAHRDGGCLWRGPGVPRWRSAERDAP